MISKLQVSDTNFLKNGLSPGLRKRERRKKGISPIIELPNNRFESAARKTRAAHPERSAHGGISGFNAFSEFPGLSMKNTKIELRDYLQVLIHRFLNTKSVYQELKRIHGWKTPARIEAYNLGAYSFELAEYSLFRIVLVEIAALLSNREERSVIDWLKKAREHARSLEPTRYRPTDRGSARQAMNEKTYRALIEQHEDRLAARKDVIDRIKAWRDKAIAHLDRVYFDSPQALDEQYPLTYPDIDRITDEVSEILRKPTAVCLGQICVWRF